MRGASFIGAPFESCNQRLEQCGSDYQEALRHILQEAERTSLLVEKLLSLARADAGGESLEIRRLELGETVRQVALDWHGVMTAHRLQFTENLTTREVPIAGDRTAMCRLLNILLDNAVKYTPQPGSVDLQLDTDGEKARISVVDTGIGINEEDRSRIFERFYRTDKARSRESGGLVLDCQSPTGS